ncbi:hypothetical protein [Halorubrum sp. SD626R]|uniref:hypothetical protein n=1 Tax=Halorubrum sp. SD626R TaxID=1419722 RepID=UPI0018EEC87D|nr:hypothetical protein [Halorubrum sp. SD626R]
MVEGDKIGLVRIILPDTEVIVEKFVIGEGESSFPIIEPGLLLERKISRKHPVDRGID